MRLKSQWKFIDGRIRSSFLRRTLPLTGSVQDWFHTGKFTRQVNTFNNLQYCPQIFRKFSSSHYKVRDSRAVTARRAEPWFSETKVDTLDNFMWPYLEGTTVRRACLHELCRIQVCFAYWSQRISNKILDSCHVNHYVWSARTKSSLSEPNCNRRSWSCAPWRALSCVCHT